MGVRSLAAAGVDEIDKKLVVVPAFGPVAESAADVGKIASLPNQIIVIYLLRLAEINRSFAVFRNIHMNLANVCLGKYPPANAQFPTLQIVTVGLAADVILAVQIIRNQYWPGSGGRRYRRRASWSNRRRRSGSDDCFNRENNTLTG